MTAAPQRRLTILQVITQRRFSGAERICLTLCADMQRRGHRVLLLCKPAGGMPEEARKLGIEVQTPPIAGKLNLAAPLFIARAAREFGADLIHTHLSSASLWGSLAGRLAGIPVLTHVHALNTWHYYRFGNRAITCSQGVRQHLLKQGADPQRVTVVYNGIDASRLNDVISGPDARRMLGLLPDQPVVGCVAHLSEKKGQKYLLQAVALLKERFPRLVCLLAGEGEQFDELRRMTGELGIADQVCLLGFREDVISVMNAMDVVVLPSIAKEGLGLALVEAALLEKPTIGSNAPGIDEVIEDGVTGLLTPPGNAALLAETLALLLDDAGLRHRMGHAGRSRALGLFSMQTMCDRVETAYGDLIHHT
ncbi:glycosyltransferase family 4 protein [Trichlorobacter ammonificans]|uniref:Glycosyltransferase involved in cell wall bisynthesis n=1 Tax=Trichlorobacter ammonificans TaxID=2916410 RepID=A0ABN8HCN9_9BACT|nr:glycosyltransferase family 4 protein [Trichlorobacter ammonificans]CAH2030474.1 Glycosyltransferase involved in cell wall bisynthesis [Trichlorobacter ammonificans]